MKTDQFINFYNEYFGDEISNISQLVSHTFSGVELLEFVSAVLEIKRREPRYDIERFRPPFVTKNQIFVFDADGQVVATMTNEDTANKYCDFLNNFTM